MTKQEDPWAGLLAVQGDTLLPVSTHISQYIDV